jgi:hypothetical protein
VVGVRGRKEREGFGHGPFLAPTIHDPGEGER